MKLATKLWAGVSAVLLVGFALGLGRQWQSSRELRRRVAQARRENSELDRLQELNQQARAVQIPESELENLRADHVVLSKARQDLDQLRKGTRQDAADSALQSARSALEAAKMSPASAWRNAGRATPRATIETVLWAGKNGDPTALANALELSAWARTKAEAIMAGMNDEARAQYRTPEDLVALLTARSISFSGMAVVGEAGDADQKNLVVVLQQPGGPPKKTQLVFHRDDADWRLVVPESAVVGYGAMLQGATPDAAK